MHVLRFLSSADLATIFLQIMIQAKTMSILQKFISHISRQVQALNRQSISRNRQLQKDFNDLIMEQSRILEYMEHQKSTKSI